jgi:Family of unknown function (DUF6496)
LIAARAPGTLGRAPAQPGRKIVASLKEDFMAQRRKRKYSRAAGREVEDEMRRFNRGTARSGKGGKAGKVKSRKQAIAIALSKARKKGERVPKRR